MKSIAYSVFSKDGSKLGLATGLSVEQTPFGSKLHVSRMNLAEFSVDILHIESPRYNPLWSYVGRPPYESATVSNDHKGNIVIEDAVFTNFQLLENEDIQLDRIILRKANNV